ncbi:MAG TPA: imidazole glycerol phosphate synthase subunit HisH [Myxococcota bacterium]|nr:imidazole glycerol phosphate synthase subunit HisH [Myxococcales bacterium]HPG27233.1 imidazole glycerol phosphate synthase subunit HisH [Myxococcota bacterium]
MGPRIALVDYGAGNLRSVAKALERSGMEPVVTGDPAVVRAADGVLLPGVGAFRDAVNALTKAGLVDVIREVTDHGRPYLGICFGLQLLFEEGEEHGVTPGLGILGGRVTRFPETDEAGEPLVVPHIGWNEVRYAGDHPMLESLPERDVYYFVHSYRPVPTDPSIIVGRADYGGEFTAAVARDNVFAVQFHPEKSQSAGKRLLDAYRVWLEQS